jgi:hypothetical protein
VEQCNSERQWRTPEKQARHSPTLSQQQIVLEKSSAWWPNDPKLSHGAENRKREFAANLQMKEQPPLAPARC